MSTDPLETNVLDLVEPIDAEKLVEEVLGDVATNGDEVFAEDGNFDPKDIIVEDIPDDDEDNNIEHDIQHEEVLMVDRNAGGGDVRKATIPKIRESLEAVRIETQNEIGALLRANTALVGAYNKGSNVDFIFEGNDESDVGVTEASDAFVKQDPESKSVKAAPPSIFKHDTKESVFPTAATASDPDQWVSVLRAEFKNLFENGLPVTDAAGKSISEREANPPYFAWSTSGEDEEEQNKDTIKAVPLSPVSTDPAVGCNEWITEYDATSSVAHTTTATTRIAGVQTSKKGAEPSNFAYPIMEVKAPDVIHPPLGYSVSFRDLPGPTSEYRTSFNWEGKDTKMIKKAQPYTLTPMGLDNTLLNASEWTSEYDNSYTEPPPTSLDVMTITSTIGANKSSSKGKEWVLPAPAGVVKKASKGKKVYNKTYSKVAPYAVTKALGSPKRSVYGADYAKPTTLIPHFAGSPTRLQEVLSGSAGLVKGKDEAEAFQMVDVNVNEPIPPVPPARETIHVKFATNDDNGTEDDYEDDFEEDDVGAIESDDGDFGVEMINLNPDLNAIESNNDDVVAINVDTDSTDVNNNIDTYKTNNIITGPYTDDDEVYPSTSMYTNNMDINIRDIMEAIPIHGKTTPLEPPLWVNGGYVPATIFRPASPSNKGKYINNYDKDGKNLSNDAFSAEDSLPVPPPIVLPPFAVDIRLVGDAQFPLPKQKVVGRKPNEKELKRIFEIIKKHEEKKKLMNDSNNNKTTTKTTGMKKYKNYTGPNRAIKGAPRYGTDGARAARVASNRAYKENKKSLNNAVLSNPRYPILSEKQANRWGTVSKTSFKKKSSNIKKNSNIKQRVATL